MISRVAVALATIGAVIAVACVDMSAPKGAASISMLRMAQPAVVLGDTLRDSTGAIDTLNVIAFDAAGAQLSGQTPRFFITDTTRRAHLTSDTRTLVGDSIGPMHIVGQVGELQTPVVTVQVTFAPQTLQKVGKDTTLVLKLGPDSSSSIARVTLAATLHAANDSASQGFIVQYRLLRAPSTRTDKRSPAVFIADNGGNLASSDTSDATGVSRQLTVVSAFLGNQDLLSGHTVDTAIVQAHIRYRGVLVADSVLWKIPISLLPPK